jgi:hypothetical protein
MDGADTAAGATVLGMTVTNPTTLHRLATLVDRLVEEPLFHASLGSKELFHTNLLAWMARTHPEMAREVLAPWLVTASGPSVDQVRCEFRRLDLVVEFAACEPLVVENKTFALPDEQQLARYSTDAVPHVPGNPTLVLLSLGDPGWADGSRTLDGRTWTWVSYRELSGRILAALAGSTGFAADVLRHEADLLGLLDDLMALAGVTHPDESLWMAPDQHAELGRARIADAVRKARGHHIMRQIKQRLGGVRPPAWEFEVGFAHGEPLLAAFWECANNVFVGWQQQGHQWRLAMIMRANGLVGRGLHYRRATYARDREGYFDFTATCETLQCSGGECLPRASVGPAGFNRFDPDFVYRYRRLPETTTVGAFVDLAVHYSRWAASWALEESPRVHKASMQ